MITKDKASIEYQAQESFRRINNEIVDREIEGNYHNNTLQNRRMWIAFILWVLDNAQWYTDAEVTKLLSTLERIARTNEYPVVPRIYNRKQPVILKGIITDKSVVQIIENPTVYSIVSGMSDKEFVKTEEGDEVTFTLIDKTYVAPVINVEIQTVNSSSVSRWNGIVAIEKGIEAEVGVLVTSEAGTIGGEDQTVVSRSMTSPGGITLSPNDTKTENASFVYTATDDTDFSGLIQDAGGSDADTDSINFYYPILWGVSDTVLDATGLYGLTKIITGKESKTLNFVLNGEDKYYNFLFPESYGDLSAIIDKNGNQVLSAFTKSSISITSTGLDSNWTNDYTWYRLTEKTDISGKVQFVWE